MLGLGFSLNLFFSVLSVFFLSLIPSVRQCFHFGCFSHLWLRLTHKGFSGLREFLLVEVPVFVFIKGPRVLYECIGIVNAVFVHDTIEDGF